jgi:hypothetical protein
MLFADVGGHSFFFVPFPQSELFSFCLVICEIFLSTPLFICFNRHMCFHIHALVRFLVALRRIPVHSKAMAGNARPQFKSSSKCFKWFQNVLEWRSWSVQQILTIAKCFSHCVKAFKRSEPSRMNTNNTMDNEQRTKRRKTDSWSSTQTNIIKMWCPLLNLCETGARNDFNLTASRSIGYLRPKN